MFVYETMKIEIEKKMIILKSIKMVGNLPMCFVLCDVFEFEHKNQTKRHKKIIRAIIVKNNNNMNEAICI